MSDGTLRAPSALISAGVRAGHHRRGSQVSRWVLGEGPQDPFQVPLARVRFRMSLDTVTLG